MDELHKDVVELNALMNQFQNDLSETDAQNSELDLYIENIETGVKHLDTLIDIHESLDPDRINEPALEAISIYINKSYRMLGLEDSAMVAAGSVIDHNVKEEASEKKKKLWDTVIEFIKKIFNAVAGFFKKLVSFIKDHFNVLFLYIEKFTTHYEGMLKKLPDHGDIYSKKVEIKNYSLVEYFHITDNSSVTIEKAEYYAKQFDLLMKINEELDKFLRGASQKLILSSDIKIFVELAEKHVFVKGITIHADKEGVNIEFGKGKINPEIYLITPEGKSKLVYLNKYINSTSKNFYNYYASNTYVSMIYDFISSTINSKNFERKGMSPEEARVRSDHVKSEFLTAAKFIKYLFYITTETYRAEIKYMSTTVNEMHKLLKEDQK